MKLLLDTHVFLWWNEGSPRLSKRASGLLADPENTLLLSAASVWEIVLKVRTGKLQLPSAARDYVPARMAHYGIEPLPITLAHVLASEPLPFHHRDPFDRILVAQAQVERLPLITQDPLVRQYSVKTIW